MKYLFIQGKNCSHNTVLMCILKSIHKAFTFFNPLELDNQGQVRLCKVHNNCYISSYFNFIPFILTAIKNNNEVREIQIGGL